jgi:hypothetical protein
MHPFSILTLGIFVAGYITARWDLVTRLYELAIFAWDHGVVVSLHFGIYIYIPPENGKYAERGRGMYPEKGRLGCNRIMLIMDFFSASL